MLSVTKSEEQKYFVMLHIILDTLVWQPPGYLLRWRLFATGANNLYNIYNFKLYNLTTLCDTNNKGIFIWCQSLWNQAIPIGANVAQRISGAHLTCVCLGPQIAREHGIRFMETSAKSNINIDRAFSELAEAILDKSAGREADADHARIAVERRPSRAPPARACCS